MSSNVLRFTTAGNVDDGKSTLIGRLLVETQGAFEDQIEGANRENERRGGKGIDFSLLTDGLKAEREQGITSTSPTAISQRPSASSSSPTLRDTSNTRAISSRAPATAIWPSFSSTRRNGMMTQSRRHAFIAHLLGIRSLHRRRSTRWISSISGQEDTKKSAKTSLTSSIGWAVPNPYCIPISALQGDYVTEPSERMSWYTGPKILELLESIHVDDNSTKCAFRFPIQLVSRPPASASGIARLSWLHGPDCFRLREGGRSCRHPSKGKESTVTGIVTQDGPLEEAFARQSVTLMLADDIDISRGDLLASPVNSPKTTAQFKATLCWMNEHKLRLNQRYVLRLNTQSTRAIVNEIDF